MGRKFQLNDNGILLVECYGVSTEEARARCKFDRARARNHDIMRCGDWSPTLISV